MSELKFVITGTPGVGKTTAIVSLSDVPPVSSDVFTTDALSAVKSSTTVALDFGEVLLDDGTHVRIYGTPGQKRFSHMWDIVAEGALGLIILVDDTRPEPIEDLKFYMNFFSKLISNTGVVIGVTRHNPSNREGLEKYYHFLESKGFLYPVMEIDPRNRQDMVATMDTLISILEYA